MSTWSILVWAGAFFFMVVPVMAQGQSASLPAGAGKEMVEGVCTGCHTTAPHLACGPDQDHIVDDPPDRLALLDHQETGDECSIMVCQIVGARPIDHFEAQVRKLLLDRFRRMPLFKSGHDQRLSHHPPGYEG
jgi:hypothetical protein